MISGLLKRLNKDWAKEYSDYLRPGVYGVNAAGNMFYNECKKDSAGREAENLFGALSKHGFKNIVRSIYAKIYRRKLVNAGDYMMGDLLIETSSGAEIKIFDYKNSIMVTVFDDGVGVKKNC